MSSVQVSVAVCMVLANYQCQQSVTRHTNFLPQVHFPILQVKNRSKIVSGSTLLRKSL